MMNLTNDLRIRRRILASLMLSITFSVLAMGSAGGTGAGSLIQSGSSSCTVASGGNNCTTSTITFPTAYINNPVIGQLNLTLSPLAPGKNLLFPGPQVSNLITYQVPDNQTILAHDDESSTGAVNIPNVDTILKSWNPAGTEPWPNMIVEGEGWITTSLTSAKQVISILVEDCVLPQVFQTLTFETESLAVGRTPFAIKGVVPNNGLGLGFGCESIDVQAPASDTNTQITLVSLRVYGLDEGFRTWVNMPAALTEIYGSTNLEQQFYMIQINGVTMKFCVNIISPSSGVGTYLSPYTDAGELNSGLRVLIDGSIGTGMQCSIANANLPATGFHTVTVKGSLGAGQDDLPSFGAISLSWIQQNPTLTILVPLGYHIQILGLTPVSFKLKIQFDGTLSATDSATFNWQSIGT
jgi:hypothetical protein